MKVSSVDPCKLFIEGILKHLELSTTLNYIKKRYVEEKSLTSNKINYLNSKY